MKMLKLIVVIVLLAYVHNALSQAVQNLQGVIRDQSPSRMNECGYSGACCGDAGSANGTYGWVGTDFQLPLGYYTNNEKGLVGNECNPTNGWTSAQCGRIGADRTPVYAYPGLSPGKNIQSPQSFYRWFHDSEQTMNMQLTIPLTSTGGNVYSYTNWTFFPLDGKLWGDHCPDASKPPVPHNYAYCFEAHFKFGYQGGEVFDFTGDDDVWVFINDALVIDLGSLHQKLSESVSLDTLAPGLGLVKATPSSSTMYKFDFFYCERHTTESNMQISTSLVVTCSYNDWCGVCEGNGQSCCTPALIAQYCNDNNPCTIDSCGVQVPPASNGCKHTPVNCTTSNICFPAQCSTQTGQCVTSPLNCDDGNACTQDTCDPVVGCQHSPISCDDKSLCTQDTCDKVLGCQHSPVQCGDSSACTQDGCNPATGCYNTPIKCPDSTCYPGLCDKNNGCGNTTLNCNDNSKCTTDTCVQGSGCSYAKINCDDGNACTQDGCDPATGCTHTDISSKCNDNNACTTDSCDPKAGCINSPVDCSTTQPCQTGSCAPNGTCITTPIPNCSLCLVPTPKDCTSYITDKCVPWTCSPSDGQCHAQPRITCDDGSNCTVDSCDSTTGLCKFTPKNCTDSNLCTLDTCDKVKGCLNTPITCDDNNTCTNDACNPSNGLCVFTPKDCSSPDLCNPGSCNQTTGSCQFSPVICDDGNLCTNDMCSTNGTCIYTLKNCSTNPCAPGKCNMTTGQCYAVPFSCDDGNQCTTDTVVCDPNNSTGPTCVHTTNATICNDGLTCTTDYCNSSVPIGQNPCQYTPTVCPTPDACTINNTCVEGKGCVAVLKGCATADNSSDYCKLTKCDTLAGCISEPRVCPNQDIGCFDAVCNNVSRQCTQVQKSNFNHQNGKGGINCVLLYNKKVRNATITAGALAGLIIGCIAAAALIGIGGKVGYDFLMARNSPSGAVMTNALYTESQAAGRNAMYE